MGKDEGLQAVNGFEHIHECIGSWTDDGVWQVSPDDPIVRCKDCALYDREDGLCYRSPNRCGSYRPAHDDGFCEWAKKLED